MCDGYLPEKPRISAAIFHKKAQTSSTELIPIAPTPSVGITGTNRERRGFAYFCWETGQDIGQALKLDLAYRLILQTSHSNPAVRCAVVALGSIGERLHINNVLTLENKQANSCHEFAQVQYCKALKHLREQIINDPRHSEDLAIILCFLFILFDFLQGNDTASMVHLRSGLNMLRRQDGPPDLLRQELLRIFSIMDLQATLWIGLKTFQCPMLIPVIPGHPPVKLEPFFYIEDAATSLNFQIMRMYYFRRHITNEIGEQRSPNALASKRDLETQLERWPLALERLLIDLEPGMSGETLHRVLVMRMNYITTRIALAACLHEDEEQVFLAHLPHFRDVISLAKTVIRPMDDLVKARVQRIVAANNADINPIAIFSFYAGVVQPLYMTAIQCTNVALCREAIELLSSPPWREGAWDSATMARMAERRVRQREKRAMMGMALI